MHLRNQVCSLTQHGFIENHYSKFFHRKVDEKVGVELEFPILSINCKKWSPNIVSLLNDFIQTNLHFTPNKYAQEIPISFVNPLNGDVISYEVTHSTLEFSLSPQYSIQQLESNFLQYFIPIQEYLLRQNTFLAATGLHPFEYHRSFAPLPDPHYLNIYAFLRRYSSAGHIDYKHPTTMMLGSQTHIEVPFENIYQYLNTFHAFGWIECLLLANSPKSLGNNQYMCYRDILLRKSGFGYNPKNVQYPSQYFHSNQEYFDYFTGLSIFTKSKNGHIKYFSPVPIKELNHFPFATRPIDLDISLYLEDIEHCLHFNPIRITTYGTLEIRSTCQQPLATLFTPTALHRAIKFMVEDPLFFPNEYWTCHAEDLRMMANLRQISFESKQNLIFKLLKKFHSALSYKMPGEEKYLEPLFEYLGNLTNPALEQCKHTQSSKHLINYLLSNSLPC